MVCGEGGEAEPEAWLLYYKKKNSIAICSEEKWPFEEQEIY